ncbi:MAG TPA: phosphoprotein phosphatase, partial [Myxococcales bacterium]|nr:phosphoprotein phosphatase [Myxococcales bacterium]
MRISFGAKTDIGQQRQHNEDNFLIDRKLRLFVTCDGMGGHAGGHVASALAVNLVRDELSNHFSDAIQGYDQGDESVTAGVLLNAIETSVQRTCFSIYERGQTVPAERGMGTTLSLVLLCGSRAFIGHVGDSRVYLIRGGNIYQLTEDHSLLNELIKAGQPPDPETMDSRIKNAVTRAVGVHPSVDVDTLDMAVLPGDRFLLCSDGLHRYGDPQTWLNKVMTADNEENAAQALIDYANEQGGADNITAALVRVKEVPDGNAEATQLKLDTFRSLVLFRYLSYHELLKVLNLTHERLVKKGEYIFKEGDLENCTYVILKGRIQIRKANV